MKRPFIVDEYVRWSDVDHAGIIFYGAYVRFFEIAETEMFRVAGIPFGEFFDRFEIFLPRVHLECDFKYPARLDDRLRVAAYVTRIGNTSIRLNYDVLHIGARRLAAVAHEVLVCTNGKTLKPERPPREFLDHLDPFVLDEETARTALYDLEGEKI